MGIKIQFMIETIIDNEAQWVATFDSPSDETLLSLLGTPIKKNKLIQTLIEPKGLPQKYSAQVGQEIHSRETSLTNKNITISFFNQNEFTTIYKRWKQLHKKTESLKSIEMMMSFMHQFSIREWGKPRIVYCAFE